MASGGFVQDFLQDFLHADGSAQQTTTFLWSANAEKTTREQLCATPNTEVVVFLQCHPHLLDTTIAAIVNQPKYIQVLGLLPKGAARGATLEEKLGKGVRYLGGDTGLKPRLG